MMIFRKYIDDEEERSKIKNIVIRENDSTFPEGSRQST